MNPDEESYPKSPPSIPIEPQYPFAYGSLFTDTSTFSVSPSSGFKTFSTLNPPHMFDSRPESIVPEEENIEVPRPLEALESDPIPPFLSKTFDLVNDRVLDPIISWGPTAESFVVWDPMEFARIVLPRNFKHNNFSSFVRQLNTYAEEAKFVVLHPAQCSPKHNLLPLRQGFRKIDTDRWEFANEAFQRGKKHLLKTITRRKAPQSLQVVGSHIGPCAQVEGEIERLRKERCVLMQEVAELQRRNQGTVHEMEMVNQRLQAAEERQKQMVSFLAKVLQNPALVERIQQKKEIGGSSRMRRRFVRQQPEMGNQESSEWRSVGEQSPDHLLEAMVGKLDLGIENVVSQMEVQKEISPAHNYIVTFPEEMAKERNFTESSSPWGGDITDMSFDGSAGYCGELWDVPELGGIWDSSWKNP